MTGPVISRVTIEPTPGGLANVTVDYTNAGVGTSSRHRGSAFTEMTTHNDGYLRVVLTVIPKEPVVPPVVPGKVNGASVKR